ncbi:DNA-binding response regulator, OmpR family, contains REC and winged-helix (wHTH) domain [Microbulbifer donghaiensis]|uniref:DNA-binding response regulator, OmpR family, contains REC and winged-helix (WHTH) domain n=1 Tax=Microbulbifer donghaiensis TaxID=494016 RepID=A0A1M4XZA6_9GAMM|nr:response regulator transcription factor [Microbulbifer donghaiensis]SHE98633.1 DNA-binding response regulator, OmpR family, contains REC and winged-helix (wHTH) domain [Microbulbifer donghaiensis]
MTNALHILVVEDQAAIRANIATYLEGRGHVLDFAGDGAQGLALALAQPYDLVVLDLMLPGMDGLAVCRALRARASRHIPVLMLTARDSLADKVEGFGTGADDYLTKPFALEELEVRALALARRHLLNTEQVLELGALVVDRQRREVRRDGLPVRLNAIDYRIVEALAEAYPQVMTRSELVWKIWGDEPTESDALRTHIYQIRRALDKPFDRPLLKTVHGVGFVLEV